jgi:hypothetical protein
MAGEIERFLPLNDAEALDETTGAAGRLLMAGEIERFLPLNDAEALDETTVQLRRTAPCKAAC